MHVAFLYSQVSPYDNNCSNLSNKYELLFSVCTWHSCHDNAPQTGDITVIEMALALLKMNFNKELQAERTFLKSCKSFSKLC